MPIADCKKVYWTRMYVSSGEEDFEETNGKNYWKKLASLRKFSPQRRRERYQVQIGWLLEAKI